MASQQMVSGLAFGACGEDIVVVGPRGRDDSEEKMYEKLALGCEQPVERGEWAMTLFRYSC